MDKKKLSFITFHRAYNYGAALQTYATMMYFEKKGLDVQIIDYVPEYLRDFGTFKNTFNQVDNKKRNILLRFIYAAIKNPSYKKLRKVFTNFYNKYYKLSKSFSDYDSLCKNDLLSDYYCVGSDQVWNNYYTEKFDDALFLNFLSNNELCFSFASSFGKDSFSSDDEEFIKSSLKKFNFITVRENTGKKLLDKLGFDDSVQLLDPTLMVDFDEWNKLADISERVIKGNYVLVYQLHGDSDAYDYATEFAKKNNMKVVRIITMYHQMKKGAINVIVPEVEKFLNLFKNAEYVFTDSFHGTAFSLIFNKKLGIRLPVRFSGRITSLLELIDSKDLIINDLSIWEKSVDNNYINVARNKLMDHKSVIKSEFDKKFDKLNKEK